jgi:hypothetical protein
MTLDYLIQSGDFSKESERQLVGLVAVVLENLKITGYIHPKKNGKTCKLEDFDIAMPTEIEPGTHVTIKGLMVHLFPAKAEGDPSRKFVSFCP